MQTQLFRRLLVKVGTLGFLAEPPKISGRTLAVQHIAQEFSGQSGIGATPKSFKSTHWAEALIRNKGLGRIRWRIATTLHLCPVSGFAVRCQKDLEIFVLSVHKHPIVFQGGTEFRAHLGVAIDVADRQPPKMVLSALSAYDHRQSSLGHKDRKCRDDVVCSSALHHELDVLFACRTDHTSHIYLPHYVFASALNDTVTDFVHPSLVK